MSIFSEYFAQSIQIMYDSDMAKTSKVRKTAKKATKSSLKSNNSVVKKVDESSTIYGVTIFGTQLNEVLRKLWLQRKEMLHVATVNSEFIMEARRNELFRSILSRCLTVADGYGVVWAAKILYNQTIERITGDELVEQILRHAELNREKVFLLGSAPGVAQRAAFAMQTKYPQIKIESYSGAESVEYERKDEASMTIARINAFEPDYLLVAYGNPVQDIWIEENRPYLRARVAIGVGGVFDVWAGIAKPCPAWMDSLGLKWLWRVAHEPTRFGRILKVWQFGFLVLIEKLRRSF